MSDLKQHARIDETIEDTLIEYMLDEAEDAVEEFTWRKLLTQTWDQYFDGFQDPMRLRFGPVSSITSVSYTDGNGDSQTLATTVYELGEVDEVPVVRLKYDQSWPDTRAHEDVVTVRFVCGYGTASDVPLCIQQAIRIHVGWSYRNRGDMEVPFPSDFFRKLRSVRLMRHLAIGPP